MKSNFFLVLFSVIMALFLGEVAIRISHLAPAVVSLNIDAKKSGYKSSSNPILGYELKANYQDHEPSLHGGNFPKTNSHGQRDRERTYWKPPGIKRIIILGDSVVAGHGILNLDDTIPRQLERSLPTGTHIEVLNLGVGGYQTLAEAELLRTKGVKYDPDLVILVVEDNDFDAENNDIMSYDPQLSGLVKTLFKKSHLFRFMVITFDIGRMRFLTDLDYRRNQHRLALRDSVEEGIARMKAAAREQGFELLVVVWPRFSYASPLEPTINDLCPIAGQYERLLKIEAICKKYDLASYRLADYFIKDYQKISAAILPKAKPISLNNAYSVDTMHPNVYGSGVAARGILDILYQRKFLRAPLKN